MKRTNGNILMIVASLMLMLAFQNCSKAGIQISDNLSAEQASSTPDAGSDPSVPTEKASQSFESTSQYKTLDMVWVVDNSASMTKNVSLTKSNIASFFSSLSQEMDVNVTLITKADQTNLNTSFRLSDYTSLGSQIDFMVHSYNPMLVAAATTCPVVPSVNDTFCRQVQNNYRYNDVYGALNGFFRPNSLKVFVFVTDDDSSSPGLSTMQYNAAGGGYVTEGGRVAENNDFISANGFKQRMASAFGSTSAFKSFGFVSLPNGASCRARVSHAYMELNAANGGDSFDICASDWSASFSTLTSRVTEYAATTYVVSDNKFISIDNVIVNNAPLTKDAHYTVNGNVVTLKAALVQSLNTYKVVINYNRKI